MEFGHYTACVRTDNSMLITNYTRFYDDQKSTQDDRQWTYFNDEQFDHLENENQIRTRHAYLLFYRRRTHPKQAL